MSRSRGHPFDQPQAVLRRYEGAWTAAYAFWSPHAKIRSAPPGSRLVVALRRPGVVRWGRNGWQDITENAAQETNLGFYAAVLDTEGLYGGQEIDFTIRWQESEWIGADFRIKFVPNETPDV